jgi:hypothetical protein
LSDEEYQPGDKVRCLVWELLSCYDREGVILEIEKNECLVQFETKTFKMNPKFLAPIGE